LAREEAHRGIRINSISPGMIFSKEAMEEVIPDLGKAEK